MQYRKRKEKELLIINIKYKKKTIMKAYIVVFKNKKDETLKYTEVITAKDFNEIVKTANMVKRIKLKNEFYIKSISEA